MGCDVSERARTLATTWVGHADGSTCPFADLHAVAAELMAGDDAAVELRIAALKKVAGSHGQTAECQRDVGVPLAEGFTAFHHGNYARAAELLFPTRLIAHRFGGSHAQRDIIDWTLAEASIRGRQKNLALALAHERMALKPHSVPNREFLRRAEAL